MNSHPVFVVAVLLVIECALLALAKHPSSARFFKFIPHIFWIYFLPMLCSTFGWIDASGPIFQSITQWVLPMSLLILLMTVDVPAILKLGPLALAVFAAGSVSVGIGMVFSFALFRDAVGGEYWSGFGALAGSWTGGSANMIAVKEALGAPDNVFLPLVVVDAVLPYLWMAFLIAASRWQAGFDRWNRACEQGVLRDLKDRMRDAAATAPSGRMDPAGLGLVLALGAAGAVIAKCASGFLPVASNVISPFTWVIIIVSLLGLGLSMTPARQLQAKGSNAIGYFLLYFVLTTIGARANLSQMGETLVLMAAGLVVIAVHALGLFVALRLLKAPFFLAAAASQANLGGVASAPVVAEVYQKGLAPLGLLMAILGNIIGTYIGISVGQICRLFS